MVTSADTDRNKSNNESGGTNKKRKKSNMHEGIAIWCDCCSCEPEPRWVEVAEEFGIDLSDYEE